MSPRDSYEAMAQSGFAEVQSHLSAMAASVKNALAAGRADAERLLLAAQSKHDEALHRLELLKRASEGSWHSVKNTFETSWTELRHALGLKA